MPTGSDLRLPSIDGLRAFDAAARLGTFERAATELHVTASAVAKRVGTVEDLLGTALFTRTGKTLVLTAAGREYLEQVRAALGLLTAMPQHQRSRQRVQKLRISTPPTFARQILVPQLQGFTSAHPQVELEIVLSIPFLDHAPAEADVEVRHGDPQALGGTVLMDDVVLPLASPALLQELRLKVPADLARAPLLRTPIEPWAPWFRAAGLDWPEPERGPRLVDLGLTLEAAVSGQGVALGRPSLARRWLESGILAAPWTLTAVPASRYCLSQHPGNEAAAAFAHWLHRVCQDELAAALCAMKGLKA
jgi:LysR family transcriptional regulator, glycine cleavage system transcriptional activator